jgi:hypothetical protein
MLAFKEQRMSRIRFTVALIAAAGLTCGTVFAQMSQPATNPPPAAKTAPAPRPVPFGTRIASLKSANTIRT